MIAELGIDVWMWIYVVLIFVIFIRDSCSTYPGASAMYAFSLALSF